MDYLNRYGLLLLRCIPHIEMISKTPSINAITGNNHGPQIEIAAMMNRRKNTNPTNADIIARPILIRAAMRKYPKINISKTADNANIMVTS